MRRALVTIGLVAALGLAGCGGGSSKEKTSATTAATTAPKDQFGTDQAGTPFCQLAKTYTEKFGTILLTAGDPAKLKAASTDADSAIRQAVTTAPAAIKSDVQTVATTVTDVLAALQKNNFDISKIPDQTAKLQSKGFQDSFANMNRYVQAHCGVS